MRSEALAVPKQQLSPAWEQILFTIVIKIYMSVQINLFLHNPVNDKI
jgi:hypothetical protein